MRAIALLAALLVAGAVEAAERKLRSGVFEPPVMAPDFTLDGSDGSALKLARHRGKVVVLGFGFTHCPEICPTTLARLAKARKSLGPKAADLQVVYVTVDPERDRPATMRAYLANFDPGFIGGTGTPTQLAKVYKDYGVTGGLAHSTSVFLIDRAGRLRAMVPYGRSAEDIAHDAGILLAQ